MLCCSSIVEVSHNHPNDAKPIFWFLKSCHFLWNMPLFFCFSEGFFLLKSQSQFRGTWTFDDVAS